MATEEHRSGCPINLSLEVIGDKWSLLVIRDMMFGNRRHYRELLTNSEERIASNILGDRLRKLLAAGLVTRTQEPAIQLVPTLVHLGDWGRHHLPVSPELSIRAKVLSDGGPELWAAFMDELREQHLGMPRPPDIPSVWHHLEQAYQTELARNA